MAEIELSALSNQCLDCRIGNMEKLADEVSAWERERNAIMATVNISYAGILVHNNTTSIIKGTFEPYT